jgi:hypothetical protein
VCPVQCPGCYAKKAEVRFKAVKVSRADNLYQSQAPDFTYYMDKEIKKSKVGKFRIHESGDFYSQDYMAKWKRVAEANPTVQFYAYTKREQDFNFAELKALPNMNIINSITPLGVNYGDQKFCDELVEKHNYALCPCKKGSTVSCMKDCDICLTTNKVCFLKH